jgi:hypothetical protein
MESLTETLMERVQELLPARDTSHKWGSALQSTTPRSVAVQDLAVRTDALEQVVREMAVALQQLADELSARQEEPVS